LGLDFEIKIFLEGSSGVHSSSGFYISKSYDFSFRTFLPIQELSNLVSKLGLLSLKTGD
jgi:hypothetical protein